MTGRDRVLRAGLDQQVAVAVLRKQLVLVEGRQLHHTRRPGSRLADGIEQARPEAHGHGESGGIRRELRHRILRVLTPLRQGLGETGPAPQEITDLGDPRPGQQVEGGELGARLGRCGDPGLMLAAKGEGTQTEVVALRARRGRHGYCGSGADRRTRRSGADQGQQRPSPKSGLAPAVGLPVLAFVVRNSNHRCLPAMGRRHRAAP